MNAGNGNTGNLNTGNRNAGNGNTGNLNTGNRNAGDWNTGDLNTGNRNAGDWNTGDRNTGNLNAGNGNTGNLNTGNGNAGNLNTGDLNAGNRNTGNLNAGNRNAGDWNAGDRNTGNGNAGDWNAGNRNTGFFCTNTPSPMFFDRPTNLTWEDAYNLVPNVDLPIGTRWVDSDDMTDEQKLRFPDHVRLGGFLEAIPMTIQEAFPLAWAKMDAATQQRFLDLPNFDAEKFLACTGVDVRSPESQKEIIVDGVRYQRVD